MQVRASPHCDLIMTTSFARLPKSKTLADDQKSAYEGPNALEIIKQLFTTQACAYRFSTGLVTLSDLIS